MRNRRLILALLAFAASLARADAPIAPPQFGSSPEYPFSWQVATNGEEYLVAWSSHAQVHFAVLDERGEVVQDAALDSRADVVDAIAVQGDYFVVLDARLAVVDADTLAIVRTFPLPFNSSNTTLATDGVTALLANGVGYARLVDADGDAIAADVAFGDGANRPIGAAAAKGAYLVVWLEDGRLVRTVIRNDGAKVSADATLVTVDADNVAFGRRSVASNGENFLVSWRSGTAIDVALVSPAGSVLANPIAIANWYYTDAPQVTWNGREFVVVIEVRTEDGQADVISLRVDANGQPIGEAQSIASGPVLQYRPAVATTTHSTLAVWGEFANCFDAGYGGVMARTIEPLGAIATVSRGERAREVPAAADAGDTTLVAWVERGAVRRVRATLLPAETPVEIPVEIGVEIEATSYAQDSPAVGTNGDSFLVVWPELGDDCATSVSAVVVDRNGHAGSVRSLATDANPKTRPAIAWNGSEYVVVWERSVEAQLVAMRVAADGTPIDARPVGLTASYPNPPYYSYRTAFPAIVWTGSEYLAAWTYARTSYIPFYPDPPPVLELHTRRFARQLLPLGVESAIATPAYGSTLGWNGTEALALWRGSGGMQTSRIAAAGQVIATSLLAPNTSPAPPSLSIAWAGRDWVATDGSQLLRIRPDGSLQSRIDLGASVQASTATPRIVAYQHDTGVVTQIYTRRLAQPRRRAVQ